MCPKLHILGQKPTIYNATHFLFDETFSHLVDIVLYTFRKKHSAKTMYLTINKIRYQKTECHKH
jgi:hypothetical protein